MQYMPISFDTANMDANYVESGQQNSSNSSFSNELNSAVCKNEVQDSKENGEEDDEDDTSVYSTRAEIYSFFVPQEPRFNQDELAKLAKAFQNDNVCIEAQNALADLMNKPGGATVKELLDLLSQSTRGGNADLTSNETAWLQNLAGRANPNQPAVLYDSLRYRDGLSGMQALISALKQNPTTLSSEELSALSKAFKLPAEVQDGMQQVLASFDKNKALSSEQVDAVFKEAKALLESRSENFKTVQKSLEQNLKPLLETAQKREAEERRALMRENREVLQSKTVIEDTVISNVLGEQLNRTTVNGRLLSEKEGQNKSAQPNIDINQKAAGLEQENMLFAKVRTEHEAEIKAQNRFFEAKQEEKLQAEELGERFNTYETVRTAQSNLNGREEFSRHSFTDLKGGEQLAASFAGSQNVPSNAVFDVNSVRFADYAPDIRTQVQDSVLTMMKNGARRLEVSLNPVELGQMAVALTMKNGEINAVIQAEKAESASLISQQIEVIRQELENQGFKVQNIDVEVGFSNFAEGNSSHSWEGMQQHNNEQAFRENVQNLSWLRALSRKVSQDESTLAHNMQNIGSIVAARENNSMQGLHIIT